MLHKTLTRRTAAKCNACREDVGRAAKLPCSQLVAASCISTVLHSLALILRALCQHDAAAFMSHIPQACAESGSAFHLSSQCNHGFAAAAAAAAASLCYCCDGSATGQ